MFTEIKKYDGQRKKEVIQCSIKLVEVYKKFQRKYNDNSDNWPLAPIQASVEIVEFLLKDYPDVHFKKRFINSVKNGWSVGFAQERIENNDLFKKPQSIVNQVDQYLTIINKFIHEIEHGKVFPKISSITLSYVFSVFCVNKKPNKQGIMQFRIISNGSKRSKFKSALNDGISDAKAYVTLSQFIDYVRFFEFCNFMGMDDLTKSFRQQHTCFSDLALVGYSILGLPLHDGRQPMGIRSSSANMQQLAETLVWIVKNKLLDFEQIQWQNLFDCLLAYIDDYVSAHATFNGCKKIQDTLHVAARLLNLEFNFDKTVTPTTVGDAHGYLWNLRLKLVGLTEKRFKTLLDFINYFLKYHYCTAKAAFSISGHIMGYSFIVPEAKACVHSLIRLIWNKLNLRKGSKINPLTILFINKTIKSHLKIWKVLMLKNRFCSFQRILRPPSIKMTIATDACDIGYGLYCAELKAYAAVHFNKKYFKGIHINVKEMYAPIVAIYTFLPFITGKDIRFLIDNTAVVFSVAHKWSKSNFLMILIFELCILAVKYKFRVFVDWIATLDNVHADALSRFEWQRFNTLLSAEFNDDVSLFKNVKIVEPKRLLYFS